MSVVNRVVEVVEAIGDVPVAPTVIVKGDVDNNDDLVDEAGAGVVVVPSVTDVIQSDCETDDNNLVDEAEADVPSAVGKVMWHVYFYVAVLLLHW